MRILVASFLFLISTQVTANTNIAAGIGYDTLTGDYQDWGHQYLRGNHQFSENFSANASIIHFERFDISNQQYQLGLNYQITENHNLGVWASRTPDAVFRPSNEYGSQLYRTMHYPGGIALGYVYSDWGNTSSDQWFLEPDYYFSDFRIAWRVSLHQPEAAGSSIGHRLTGAWYYTDLSRVSLALSTGKETEGIRGNAIVTEVDAIGIFGRHHLTNRWAFEYALSHTRQGDFYDRTGVELGVFYRF